MKYLKSVSVSVFVSWFYHCSFCCGVHWLQHNLLFSPPFPSFNRTCMKTRDGWDDVKLIAGVIGSPVPRKSRCARNISGVMSFSMEPPVRENKVPRIFSTKKWGGKMRRGNIWSADSHIWNSSLSIFFSSYISYFLTCFLSFSFFPSFFVSFALTFFLFSFNLSHYLSPCFSIYLYIIFLFSVSISLFFFISFFLIDFLSPFLPHFK